MNPPKAYCPQCKQHVVFEKAGDNRRYCPICGFQYELASLPSDGASPGMRYQKIPVPYFAEGAISVLGVIARVLLIMVGLAVVGLGILFAGCTILLSTH